MTFIPKSIPRKIYFLGILMSISTFSKSQTIWASFIEPLDHYKVEGTIINSQLHCFGGLNKLNQTDTIFHYVNSLSTGISITKQSNIAKQGAIISYHKLPTGKSILLRNDPQFEWSTYSIYLEDAQNQVIDSIYTAKLNGKVLILKSILLDSSILIAAEFQSSNHPLEDGLIIQKVSFDLNQEQSVFIKRSSDILREYDFLRHNDSTFFIHTMRHELGCRLTGHRFLNSDITKYDTLCIQQIEDTLDNFSFFPGPGDVHWTIPGEEILATFQLSQQNLPHAGFEGSDAGFLVLDTKGNLKDSAIIGRYDTNDRIGTNQSVKYNDSTFLVTTMPFYADSAVDYNSFHFGTYPTLIDITVLTSKIEEGKRWTIFNGEYLMLNDLVPDTANDRFFALVTSYDFTDSASGLKRDLLIYEINNVSQHLSTSSELSQPDFSLKLYPNPASEQIRVELPEETFSIYSFFNMQGQIVKTGQINEYSRLLELNVESLIPGTYFLHLNGKELQHTERFVVQR